MEQVIAYLREFHFLSVLVRLLLAVASGSVLGFGRAQKQRNAGLRTYTLVSLGAALTILISMYENEMLHTQWAWVTEIAELKFDGTRYAAQVISGIGFLAAGTILSVSHQQVSGLTSAIGLFSAAALGLAAGAGFYECVIPGIIMIIITMEMLQPAEIGFKRRMKNITLSVEFKSIDDVSTISETIRALDAEIFDIDIERSEKDANGLPSAILTLQLSKNNSSHSAMLSSIAELDCVHAVRELIA